MKALLVLVACGSLLAQSYYPQRRSYGGDYPHHTVTFGAGAGLPRGELNGLFKDSGGISAGYGYRFSRYFQADTGLDVLFGAAGVREFLQTGLGDLRIKDYEFLIPFGGRAILPLARGRLLISGGGGGAYLRYIERVNQPSYYFRVDCPICTSRSGWAYYGLVGTSVALDRLQHFRFGVTGKVYRGHTNGEPLGQTPPVETRDHWINVFGDLSFSF